MWHHTRAHTIDGEDFPRGCLSLLAGYDASDVGGDVPLPRAPSNWAPRREARGYAVSMTIASRLISFPSASLASWRGSFDGSGFHGPVHTGEQDTIEQRSVHTLLLRKAMRNEKPARCLASRISPGGPRTLSYPVVGTFAYMGRSREQRRASTHAALR